MKTLRLALAIIFIAVFTCNISSGQRIVHTAIVNLIEDYYVEGIGTINGTCVYHLTIQLSKETGMIQKIHWVLGECDLSNEKGEKVRVIDAGHDTFGELWGFFNEPNYYCAEVWDSPWFTYPAVTDGWLDDIMPVEKPVEGTFVAMAFKYIYKGHYLKFPVLIQLHMNAHGDVIGEIVK